MASAPARLVCFESRFDPAAEPVPGGDEVFDLQRLTYDAPMLQPDQASRRVALLIAA